MAFLNEALVNKPVLIRKCVFRHYSVLPKLRRRCNKFFLTYFLMSFFVKTKESLREFPSTVIIKPELLKHFILKDLKNKKWPTECYIKRRATNDYIQNLQKQILFHEKKH